jgi:hypothetical protein
MKSRSLIFILLLLLTSCIAVDKLQLSDASFSTVTYVKNTLNYPVLVQCYFRPFNNNPFWCENELIAYSEPVEIHPNECKIVMDYVLSSGIKIFRSSDSTLLFEKFIDEHPANVMIDIVNSSNGTLSYSSEEEKKLGSVTSEQNIPKDWSEASFSYLSNYQIQDERFLCKNVPWNLYPIHFEFQSCSENLLNYNEERKNIYRDFTDGYAFVKCIVFNKEASCFNP